VRHPVNLPRATTRRPGAEVYEVASRRVEGCPRGRRAVGRSQVDGCRMSPGVVRKARADQRVVAGRGARVIGRRAASAPNDVLTPEVPIRPAEGAERAAAAELWSVTLRGPDGRRYPTMV